MTLKNDDCSCILILFEFDLYVLENDIPSFVGVGDRVEKIVLYRLRRSVALTRKTDGGEHREIRLKKSTFRQRPKFRQNEAHVISHK